MTAPAKLLLVTHSLSGGGAERFAATLATHLDRARFAPAVAAATARHTYPLPDDVPVSTLGYAGLASLPGAVRRLRHEIERLQPDVVLSNVLSTNGLTGAALRGLARRPAWVARVGNAPGAREPWLQRLWARRVYPLAHRVVSNSAEMASAVAAAYPGVRDRVVSLPNPTDFQRLEALAAEASIRRRDPRRPTILWVGRLVEQKRPDLAVEALARVRERVDARLWLAGEGALEPALRRRIARLGLGSGEGGSAVEMLGFCENPFPLMRQADLFLSTSDFEGLPNVLIESQGLGLPAVATRCPFGPAEIVAHGSTGLLVEPSDAGALAEAILELLGDPVRRAAMGRAAAERARATFDLPRVLPRWESLLLEAAEAA